MRYRYSFLLLALMTATVAAASAQARQIGYRDADGQWRVIEEKDWPQDTKIIAKFIENAVSVLRPASGATFEVTYLDVVNDTRVGFDDPLRGATRRATLEAVLDYLGSVILNTGSCDIEVRVSQTDGSGALATGGPFFFTAGPYEDSLALKHLTTGIDPAQSVPDTQVTVDFGWNWNDTTNPVSSGKFDLFTVLLHELTHGLGMITMSGPDGSSRLSPGVHSTYDNFLYTGNGTKIWNASGVFAGPASILTGSAGGVVFRGPDATDFFGEYPPIYTPSPWEEGSSIGHWDEGLSPRPVMNHTLYGGTELRSYQPFEVKMLGDIGYAVDAIGPEANLFDGATAIANEGGPIDFGSTLLGSAPLSRTFTLTNNGDETLTTSNLSIPDGFELAEALASSIDPGESNDFTIELPATTLGVISGTVSFDTNDADEDPYTFSIRGTITAPSALVQSGDTPLDGESAPVDFGLALAGATGPSQTFIVRNTGTHPLETSNLTVPAGYGVTEPMSSSIAAGGADSFTVQLGTTQTGVFSGSVSFNTNDTAHNPVTFSITGAVAEPSAVILEGSAVLPGDGTPLDFGRADLGADGPARTFTVRNDGGYSLEITNLTVPAGFGVIEPLASSIAPGGSDTFTVQLATSQTGTFSGAVSFGTNDAGNNPVTFNVTGQVVEFLSADPGWLDPSL